LSALDIHNVDLDPDAILNNDEIATILWLSGYMNFDSLNKLLRGILSKCKRKTKENTHQYKIIYEMLSEILQFLPNMALKNLYKNLKNLFPGIEEIEGYKQIHYLIEFPIYMTTMGALFSSPPKEASGWKGLNSEDSSKYNMTQVDLKTLLEIIGSNVSFLPITGVKSAEELQGAFNNATRLNELYRDIHDHNLWHQMPKPDSSLKDAKICMCGMPMCGPPGKCAKLVGNKTGDPDAPEEPESVYITIMSNPNPKEHAGSWAYFKEMTHAKTLKEHIAAITNSLYDKEAREYNSITEWVSTHGGKDVWMSGNIEALLANPASATIISQLKKFC